MDDGIGAAIAAGLQKSESPFLLFTELWGRQPNVWGGPALIWFLIYLSIYFCVVVHAVFEIKFLGLSTASRAYESSVWLSKAFRYSQWVP